MNRFAPLIARSPARSGSARARAIEFEPEVPGFANDLKLFATAFVGGLVFFGTFLI